MLHVEFYAHTNQQGSKVCYRKHVRCRTVNINLSYNYIFRNYLPAGFIIILLIFWLIRISHNHNHDIWDSGSGVNGEHRLVRYNVANPVETNRCFEVTHNNCLQSGIVNLHVILTCFFSDLFLHTEDGSGIFHRNAMYSPPCYVVTEKQPFITKHTLIEITVGTCPQCVCLCLLY
jgi:hypothetical protein